MEVIITILILTGVAFFVAPVSQDKVKVRLEEEGYRNIVFMKKLNLWEREVNVNHINLKVRTKIKVFCCLGYISAEVIDYTH